MNIDNNGNLIHSDYHSKFSHNGTEFIVDELEDSWLVTERNITVKSFGNTIEEAKNLAKKAWDDFKLKQQ